jgi:MFS family permease
VAPGGTIGSDLTAVGAEAPLRTRALGVGIVLGVVLVAFEVTAITTVMPTISEEFDGDSLYGVTLACYTLANLLSLVMAGELADRFGPLRPYLAFIAVFVGGLAVAALATSMVGVVLGRTLQGLGTGGLGPIAYTIVRRAFPEGRQPVMYAWLSAGWVVPSLVAPAVAGALTEWVGWKWVFAGMIPLALGVAAFVATPMSSLKPARVEREPSRAPAAFAAAAGIGMFAVGVQWSSPVAAGAAVIGGTAVALPALRRLFPSQGTSPGLGAILAVRVLATAAFLGVDSFVPLAADRIHGVGPLAQGFVIVGAALTWTVGQAAMARRPNVDLRRALRVGCAVQVVGIAATAVVLIDSVPLPVVFVAWMIGGLGMGVLYNPSTVAGMSHTVEGREGLVSSQLGLADAVGFSLMGAVGGGTVAIADRTDWSLTSALGTNFALAAVLAIVGIAVARGARAAATTR